MRTIEEKIIATLRSGNGFKKLSCRDSVKVEENKKIEYYLWDNLLFWNDSENVYYFTGRGWCSLTTKNRLNAILYNFLRVYIIQKNYKWILNWNNKEYLIDATNIFYFKGDKLYKKASHDVEVLPIENN